MTGLVAWFTGLPSAGKSTLAAEVAGELRLRGREAVVLDGDEVRAALVPSPGYDDTARAAFYETLARLAGLIARQGHVVLVPATAHRRAFRDNARGLAPAFLEIWVDTPEALCRQRDTKGLYAAAVAAAPGVGVGYEPPLAADVTIAPDDDDDAAARIAAQITERT